MFPNIKLNDSERKIHVQAVNKKKLAYSVIETCVCVCVCVAEPYTVGFSQSSLIHLIGPSDCTLHGFVHGGKKLLSSGYTPFPGCSLNTGWMIRKSKGFGPIWFLLREKVACLLEQEWRNGAWGCNAVRTEKEARIGMGPSCHGLWLPPQHGRAQSRKSRPLTRNKLHKRATSTVAQPCTHSNPN